MIYVAKPAKGVPKAFLDAARAEWTEIERRAETRRPSYPFKAYRHKSLKDALEALFRRKCAYCESQYEIAGYLEVEHYRPKKLYYWLAADWANLLPACKRCNNGKLAKFPLQDQKRQARRKGDEKRESPLLLNPSDPGPSRRPEKHVSFDVKDGSIHAVVIGGAASALGAKSIEVYRLTRPALSSARKDWVKRVRGQLLLSRLARESRLTAEERRVADDGLIHLLKPEQPYRALTLQILRDSGIKSGANGRRSRK